MKLIDVTVPIRDGMPVYDDNPGVHLERARSIAAGDSVNISRLDLGVHTGTHVDAPVHFIEGGDGTDSIDPEILIGEAHVVDATSLREDIDAKALATLAADLSAVPGVIEHGLFPPSLVTDVIVGDRRRPA